MIKHVLLLAVALIVPLTAQRKRQNKFHFLGRKGNFQFRRQYGPETALYVSWMGSTRT